MRYAATVLAAVASLLLVTEAALHLASFSRAPLTFDVGPSTAAYLTGFTESWEYHPVSARFAGRWAALRLPLVGRGKDVTLSMRYSRLLGSPVRVHLYASEVPLASFVAQPAALTLETWTRGGRQRSPFEEFRVLRVPKAPFPEGALNLELLLEDRSEYALAIDWVRLEGVRWTVPITAYEPRLLVAGLFLLCLVYGFGLRRSFFAGGALAAALVVWAAVDPFAMTHVAARIAWPALALALVGGGIFRSRPTGRWVMLIFLAGYLIKGAGLFHPRFFYPDVRSHRRYLLAFNQAPGGMTERGRAAQARAGWYPVRVSGSEFVFPYSPVFYVPFTVLSEQPVLIDEAMKHVALAAAAAEVWIVYWLSGLVLGSRFGVVGALLAAFLPPMFSRLLFAMWPTITGHFLDMVAVGAALLLATRAQGVRGLASFAGATLLALFWYVSSMLNLGAFVLMIGLLERRLARRVLPLFAVLALLTVAVLYRPFVVTFFHEIVPAIAAEPEPGLSTWRAVPLAFSRIPLFYGYVYPVLAFLGLLIIQRQAKAPLFRCIAAYALAFIVLMLLRGWGGRLFQDLKEILFVGPLVALTAGTALEALAARGGLAKAAAIAILFGLIGFGIAKYVSYLMPWVRLAELG